MHELADSWFQVQAQLRRAVDDSTYRLWLERLEPIELTADALVLAAPDATRGWIADRFGRVLQACAAAALGPEATVHVVSRSRAAQPTPPAAGAAHLAGRDENAPSPRHTFAQFVIGDGNRLAHAAALAVAELPALACNPLFIYGSPGVGKTHLLHSIANYARTYGDGLRVRYATGEVFTNDFLAALRGEAIEHFKRRYRGIDILLLDDVQFLERKSRTEEEFFHTFNAVHEAGAQLVITSDRRPTDLSALEERLQQRFQSGLIVEIEPADLPTRRAILDARVRHDGITIDDERVLELIATRVASSVRALEGALIRIVAYSSLHMRPVTLTDAETVLDRLYPARARSGHPNVEQIQRLTCDTFAISHEDLLSSSRAARLAWPRQIAMYLARELTDESYPQLARSFGGRNHATIIHGHRRVELRRREDSEVNQLIESLITRLSSSEAAC